MAVAMAVVVLAVDEPMADPCVCAEVRRASRVLSQRYDRALAPCGLRVTQYSLLATLARLGPSAIGRLAEELVLDRTALSRELATLRRRGLVAAMAGNDRRTRIVRLTEAGERLLTEARPRWREAQAGLRRDVGSERLTALLAELGAVGSATPRRSAPSGERGA